MRYQQGLICLLILSSFTFVPLASAATLASRVNDAFVSVFGRLPTAAENSYWLGRVNSGDKKTYEALTGAMFYQKAQGHTIPVASSKKPAASITNQGQLIKDVLPLFVKIFGNNPTNAEKAWWRKRISCGEIKNETALVKSMNYHHSKNVRQGAATICGQKAAAATTASDGIIRRSIAGISNHTMGDQVRIGIFNTGGQAINITSDGGYQIREGAKNILATLGKDDDITVSWSNGKYHVRGSGVTQDTTNEIRLVPLNQGIMQISNYQDKSATIPGKNYNRFRGIIELRKCQGCQELWAINELRTEYYLRGLAETSGSGPEEYLKALSIAARTYVLYHKVNGGRNTARGYDIGRTSDDQVYRGYEYELITPRMAEVFNKVKGVIITDNEADKPVSAVYFSDSDGRTRTAKEKWGTERFPHLQKSVADPHHQASTCSGHCVGMSAQGAYGFANKDGWSFQKILKYYYQGINLVKAY